jgi:Fe-S oxidoreductase
MTRLDRHQKALDYCTYCPKLCTFACPVSNAEQQEAVTPWAKMTLANLLRKGHLPFDAEIVEPLYHCLACRLCTSYCKHEIDVGQVLTDARAELVDRGVVHPRLTRLQENWESFDNPYGIDLSDWLRELIGPERFVTDAQAVYFPGADTIAHRPSEITATFSLFDKLGVDYVGCYTGHQLAAGMTLYRAGFRRDFSIRAERLAHQLLRYKLILTSSPQTYYTLTALFLELDINLTGRVRHVLDLVWPLTKRRKLADPPKGVPTIHDPSYEARYLRRMDQPREIVQALYGLEPVEMVYQRVSAYASGQQSVYTLMFPESGNRIAAERLRQAREVNASAILTTSPAAASALETARNDQDPTVSTLTELLDACLAATE